MNKIKVYKVTIEENGACRSMAVTSGRFRMNYEAGKEVRQVFEAAPFKQSGGNLLPFRKRLAPLPTDEPVLYGLIVSDRMEAAIDTARNASCSPRLVGKDTEEELPTYLFDHYAVWECETDNSAILSARVYDHWQMPRLALPSTMATVRPQFDNLILNTLWPHTFMVSNLTPVKIVARVFRGAITYE